MTPMVLSASTLQGDDVVNPGGEKLGKLKEVMIDITTGNVGYAVLSRGGVMGMGEKLFAVPWSIMTVDGDNEQIVLDVTEEFLDGAPGFDPDHWPEFSSPAWGEDIHRHYGIEPYWSTDSDDTTLPPLT
ncbi:MAG: PRC-barrel domain-containing protein [Acidimicrobiia bacterium]